MVNAAIIITKYLMVIVMLFYTVGAFFALRYHNTNSMRPCYGLLLFLTLVFHGVGFAAIFIYEKNEELLILYGAQLIFFLGYQWIFRRLYRKVNLILLNHMLMFLAIGFVFLSRVNLKTSKRQFVMVVAAAVITLVVPKMFSKVKAARVWGAITGIIGFLSLVLVLVLGRVTHGANLSISLGPIAIQPSEFVKISFVLLLAVLFRERHDKKRILFAGLITLAHVGVLVLSKDLGAAVIYATTFLMILYVVTQKKIVFGIGIGAGAVASVVAYQLFSHVRVRVQVWMNPWKYFPGKGEQIGNSLFGISTGGWFGVGFYQGRPKVTPLVETDFVFSGICEEMGGIIGIAIILMCIACMLMFISVAADLYLPFYKVTGIGLATIYGVQVLLNIGGVIKFIPSTGVTLPLISYGGSSVFSTFIMFGIMQELYVKQQNEVERVERARLRNGFYKKR